MLLATFLTSLELKQRVLDFVIWFHKYALIVCILTRIINRFSKCRGLFQRNCILENMRQEILHKNLGDSFEYLPVLLALAAVNLTIVSTPKSAGKSGRQTWRIFSSITNSLVWSFSFLVVMCNSVVIYPKIWNNSLFFFSFLMANPFTL